MGKKLGLSILGLVIIGVMYYFTSGSEQLIEKMKQQVAQELTSIEKEGFSVQNRKIKKSQEHFVVSFDDTAKIAQFFTSKGIQLNVNDAALFKGTKLGVDVHYLPDTYSSVSLDIYPLAFPDVVLSMTENEKEKKIFQQLLDKKTFFTHIAINKLGNGFKGSMKDINEVLNGEQNITLKMKGLTFSGDIKKQQISTIKENVDALSLLVDNDIAFTFTGFKSNYSRTGNTTYDYSTNYSIDKMILKGKVSFQLTADTLTMQSISKVKDGLASSSIQSSTKHISTEEKGKKYAFDNFTFEMKADNLDISAIDKLQHVNVNNQQEINLLVQQLISKSVHFEIPTFSIENIYNADKKLGGFSLNANANIDKTLDISASQSNPMAALSAIDANLSITLSKDLFGLVRQQPQAIMAIMLFQPKDVNGQKVYELTLKDAKLSVNGMPVN